MPSVPLLEEAVAEVLSCDAGGVAKEKFVFESPVPEAGLPFEPLEVVPKVKGLLVVVVPEPKPKPTGFPILPPLGLVFVPNAPPKAPSVLFPDGGGVEGVVDLSVVEEPPKGLPDAPNVELKEGNADVELSTGFPKRLAFVVFEISLKRFTGVDAVAEEESLVVDDDVREKGSEVGFDDEESVAGLGKVKGEEEEEDFDVALSRVGVKPPPEVTEVDVLEDALRLPNPTNEAGGVGIAVLDLLEKDEDGIVEVLEDFDFF